MLEASQVLIDLRAMDHFVEMAGVRGSCVKLCCGETRPGAG